ncbi:amylo-alpha-1,6-glucosidase, partial [Arthrospira platensis SPKY1]|nr:amylo-alpha-1,6-glucosidase [Arthrospira platensis SPKY1]
SVWPWLFGHYAEAYLKIRNKAGINKIEDYLKHFEENMLEHGIGTVSEIFDVDPPHTPRGGISYASSVGEILRVLSIIEKIKKEK